MPQEYKKIVIMLPYAKMFTMLPLTVYAQLMNASDRRTEIRWQDRGKNAKNPTPTAHLIS